MKDEPTYDDTAWIDDMASLACTVILIVLVVLFTATGFWLWGWI